MKARKITVIKIALPVLCLSFVLQGRASAQEVKVIKFDALQEMIYGQNEGISIFNFWATWCKPCLKELPYIEAVRDEYAENDVKIILVSLDDVENLASKLKPFVRKKGLKSRVVLLDETDYNAWIDKVDPSWGGAIPATLIIEHSSGKRVFLEKELQEGELLKHIQQLKNKL